MLLASKRSSGWTRSSPPRAATYGLMRLKDFVFPPTTVPLQRPLRELDLASQFFHAFPSSYDTDPISEFCAMKSWSNTMAVNCEGDAEGIFDARQRILACLQHGMRSGMGFILPTIKIQTDDSGILPGDGEGASLDQYFDQELFVSRLKRSCPRLTIYNNEDSAVKLGISVYRFSTSVRPLLNWNTTPGFGASLKSLLTWPENIYNLAFSALYTLNTQHQPRVPHSDTSNSPHYLGVHLHAFGNASRPKSPSYEEQSEHYMNLASSSSYPVIYVASDDEVSISRFREDFSKKTGILGNKRVVTKQDLLKGAHRQELNSLTWYQAAMVDHIILQSAGYFSGLVESSFSWNVASDRRAARSGGAISRGSQEENDTPGVIWQDEWSQIWSVL